MRSRTFAFFTCLSLLALASISAAELPSATVPDGLGVNIHFTDPKPGEMEMLARAGFRVIRMDFAWGRTERKKGEYDFSAYDRLMAALEKHRMRALFILDYGNPLYDEGLAPYSETGRQAFARWAAAAVERFQGRGVLWEMYNEPNIRFWKPEPKVEDYVKLAREVGQAIRRVAPKEFYVGPATSRIDVEFLDACFQGGLLEYWDAVSVHPYRQSDPETAMPEYARLRGLIERYAPAAKDIPILSGEWGYSSAWHGIDELKQGKMLPRQWLTNLACDVAVSIWYDWHDDGPDPREPEHHFGVVFHPYHDGREPVYTPKPAYLAAATFTKQLDGFCFNKRLDTGKTDEYVLLFSREEDVRLAVWTTAAEPRSATIPASPGRFQVTGHTGDGLPTVSADERGLCVTLTDAPQYLVPEAPNDLLRLAVAWQCVPGTQAMRAEQGATMSLSIRNPLSRSIRVSTVEGRSVDLAPGSSAKLSTPLALQRTTEPIELVFECNIAGVGRLAQRTQVTVTNPLRLTLGPVGGKTLSLRFENPSSEAFRGAVRLIDGRGIDPLRSMAELHFDQAEREADIVFPLAVAVAGKFQVGFRVEDEQGRMVLETPPREMRLVDDFGRYLAEGLDSAYRIVPDGDAKIGSEQSIHLSEPPRGLPGSTSKTLEIRYRMDEGWKFLRLVPRSEAVKTIEGRPRAMGLWVHGDGSGNSPRLRFVDATGQTHQPSAQPITGSGWQYLEFPFDDAQTGHWGGADDGRVHWPIRFDSLFLLDGMRKATSGRIELSSPILLW